MTEEERDEKMQLDAVTVFVATVFVVIYNLLFLVLFASLGMKALAWMLENY